MCENLSVLTIMVKLTASLIELLSVALQALSSVPQTCCCIVFLVGFSPVLFFFRPYELVTPICSFHCIGCPERSHLS